MATSQNPVLSGRQEKENSSVWLEELCLLNKEAKPEQLRVLTLVALIYLHMCLQHVNCTTYRDPPGCLVQDLWRGEYPGDGQPVLQSVNETLQKGLEYQQKGS